VSARTALPPTVAFKLCRRRADVLRMTEHHRTLAIAALSLACCALSGCVTKITEGDLRAQLQRVSTEVPKRSAIQAFVPVHAETWMEAWTYYGEARTSPDSSLLSLQLAKGFALGERRRVDYFVGGPYPELADRVVLNGLAMNKGRALPGLRIVLVSAEEPTVELVAAAKEKRVRLDHRPLP
jgi:hypothetical protein